MKRGYLIPLVAYSSLTVGASILPQEDKERKYDREPELIHEVEPEYPKEAEKAKVEGEVVLKMRIETDGSTTFVEVLEALEHGCTEAAIEAAKQWKWKPAEKDDEPVEAEVLIAFSFSLKKKKR